MAKQVGTFKTNLTPPDRLGGPSIPKHNGDFGEGGMVTGGEPMNMRGGGEDEFVMHSGAGIKRPAMKTSVARKGGY